MLKHHPDKKAGQSHTTNDDAFFKCIQKAHEVLTHPERRRQFDSVDPHYLALEEEAPTAADFKGSKANDPDFFFKLWVPVYEMAARFSKKTPVPLLGTMDDPKDKVEAFYDFWYNFDSWRSFEYLDKEVNEGSDRLVVFLSACDQLLTDGAGAVVTISGTRRRRTRPSAPGEKRKIQPGCAASSISR